jgi:5-methylcytosine-specific restriction enzyme subunit McrC
MSQVVFEYDYLCYESDAVLSARFKLISPRSFEYLEQLCLRQNDEEVQKFLHLRVKSGYKVLQVKNYVGVIFTPTGESVEVLPKTGKKSDDMDKVRQQLLFMLRYLETFRHLLTSDACIETQQMPLLEVFIAQFLQSVHHLVKRGLRSDYQSRQANLAFQKGKLLVAKQIRHNLVNQHHFYVEFDEYLQNRPANRLIRSALRKVVAYTRLARHQKWLRELDFAFADIPLSAVPAQDFQRVKLDRSMNEYRAPLAWAKLILDGMSPLSMQGTAPAPSLLFPMEQVFESYVATVLSAQLDKDYELKLQASHQYLVTHRDRKWFQLRPDLLIKQGDRTLCVLDTKWKLLDLQANHYGLSQSDFYQMLAYGQNYLQGSGDIVLIYPAHDDFNQAVDKPFEYCAPGGERALRVWVVPFEIDVDGQSRIIWPEPRPETVRGLFKQEFLIQK